MTGHKTNGSWTDVTSHSRNEIVFEGRNKDYGAYLVRQRYNGALLLALLISTSIGVLCAGIPFIVHLLNPTLPKTIVDRRVIITPYTIPTAHPPVVVPPPPPSHPRPASTTTNTIPLIVNRQPIEDIPINNHATDNPVNNNPGIPTGNDPPVIPNSGIPLNVPPPPAKPLTIVEKMPKFDDLEGYIKKHINYPDFERERGIQGVVYVTFVVETDGSLSDVELLRGISGGPGLNAEALRVIKSMPPWSAGMQNGYPVRVQLNLPIHFTLQ